MSQLPLPQRVDFKDDVPYIYLSNSSTESTFLVNFEGDISNAIDFKEFRARKSESPGVNILIEHGLRSKGVAWIKVATVGRNFTVLRDRVRYTRIMKCRYYNAKPVGCTTKIRAVFDAVAHNGTVLPPSYYAMRTSGDCLHPLANVTKYDRLASCIICNLKYYSNDEIIPHIIACHPRKFGETNPDLAVIAESAQIPNPNSNRSRKPKRRTSQCEYCHGVLGNAQLFVIDHTTICQSCAFIKYRKHGPTKLRQVLGIPPPPPLLPEVSPPQRPQVAVEIVGASQSSARSIYEVILLCKSCSVPNKFCIPAHYRPDECDLECGKCAYPLTGNKKHRRNKKRTLVKKLEIYGTLIDTTSTPAISTPSTSSSAISSPAISSPATSSSSHVSRLSRSTGSSATGSNRQIHQGTPSPTVGLKLTCIHCRLPNRFKIPCTRRFTECEFECGNCGGLIPAPFYTPIQPLITSNSLTSKQAVTAITIMKTNTPESLKQLPQFHRNQRQPRHVSSSSYPCRRNKQRRCAAGKEYIVEHC